MAGAVEVRKFEVTCAPGVLAAAPQVTNIAMPVRTVKAIRVRVPPGPSGTMGFAIGSTGANVIPIQDGIFIVADNEIFDFPPDDLLDSGSWQVRMYNIGLFPHTIYLTFTVELPDAPAVANPGIPIYIASVPAPGAIVTPSGDLPAPPTLG